MSYNTAHAEPLVRRSRIHGWFAARPRVLDVAVILMSTVPQSIGVVLQQEANGWIAGLCLVAVAIALWWRRSHPLAVFLVLSCLVAINPLYFGTLTSGAPELWFAAYALAVHTPLRVTILGFLGGILIVSLLGGSVTALMGARPPSMAGLDLFGFVALAMGVAVRASNSRRDALEELAALREERAVAAERARITAEMHDVVAHSATVMIALAGGARAGWEKHPERAREALEQLGTVAAQALEDMQRTLRLMREGDEKLDADLAHSGHNIPPLDELVGGFRAAGMPVTLNAPAVLPEDQALRTTLYRIVQESLTNALRHASGATHVEVNVDWQGDALTVTVTDDGGPHPARAGEPASTGFGLLAMRERTAAFGGVLEAGPLRARSWAPPRRLAHACDAAARPNGRSG
ncbi:sensor histidine kinase [Leucobacter komagatae]|uniref:histidine kinase n=1 Tax=Leucobacter komagatae TaxID=55969 RepID=A0A0D0H843_9MICO|nr:histidine kinase [Leucobacter komagatae]KIP53390.1 hypothetical protein SD72_04010 [Leucobacter komagatae]